MILTLYSPLLCGLWLTGYQFPVALAYANAGSDNTAHEQKHKSSKKRWTLKFLKKTERLKTGKEK